MLKDIYVDYEYGDLKEVVVGIPEGVYPDSECEWVKEAMGVLPDDEKQKMIYRSGKNFKDVIVKDGKSKYYLMEEENQNLINIFKNFGVKVHRPKSLNEDFIKNELGDDMLKNGYMQQYTRDPFVVIGNNLVEFSMGSPVRRSEIFGYKELFNSRILNTENSNWISMPQVPILSSCSEENPQIEGGDVLVLGETILVGNSLNKGVGSNEKGHKWLKKYLGDKYNVVRVPLVKEILHLDCVLSVPRKGLAILCKEAFVEGVPSYFEGWDIIELTLDECSRLSANGLPINEDNYILSYNDHYDNKNVKEELEKRGINVHMIYFGNHNEDGGSIRCSCHPFIRRLGRSK